MSVISEKENIQQDVSFVTANNETIPRHQPGQIKVDDKINQAERMFNELLKSPNTRAQRPEEQLALLAQDEAIKKITDNIFTMVRQEIRESIGQPANLHPRQSNPSPQPTFVARSEHQQMNHTFGKF